MARPEPADVPVTGLCVPDDVDVPRETGEQPASSRLVSRMGGTVWRAERMAVLHRQTVAGWLSRCSSIPMSRHRAGSGFVDRHVAAPAGEVHQGAFDDEGEMLVPVAEVVLDHTLVGLGRGGDTVHPVPATPCAASTSRRPSPLLPTVSASRRDLSAGLAAGAVVGTATVVPLLPAAHGVNPTHATAGRSPIPEGRCIPGRAGLEGLLPARVRPGLRGRSAGVV